MLIILLFQTGCFGFCGGEVDQIDYYRARISELDKKVRLTIVGDSGGACQDSLCVCGWGRGDTLFFLF
jgi:hypothetical protein